jgi:predicted Zn-dependent protease
MGAACSLRAGQIAVEAGKLDVAREFLQAVLHNHPQSDYAYYTSQAKALLSDLDTQVVQVTLNIR